MPIARSENQPLMLSKEMLDLLIRVETLAELKVLLYIFKHCGEYNSAVISLDEFTFGAKNEDGDRTDAGCGESSRSVQRGIKDAIEHGFLNIEIDDTDKGRIKRWFSLNVNSKNGVQ